MFRFWCSGVGLWYCCCVVLWEELVGLHGLKNIVLIFLHGMEYIGGKKEKMSDILASGLKIGV
jgi:hypothetical protein